MPQPKGRSQLPGEEMLKWTDRLRAGFQPVQERDDYLRNQISMRQREAAEEARRKKQRGS